MEFTPNDLKAIAQALYARRGNTGGLSINPARLQKLSAYFATVADFVEGSGATATLDVTEKDKRRPAANEGH